MMKARVFPTTMTCFLLVGSNFPQYYGLQTAIEEAYIPFDPHVALLTVSTK